MPLDQEIQLKLVHVKTTLTVFTGHGSLLQQSSAPLLTHVPLMYLTQLTRKSISWRRRSDPWQCADWDIQCIRRLRIPSNWRLWLHASVR
jgi:hypothetical protein